MKRSVAIPLVLILLVGGLIVSAVLGSAGTRKTTPSWFGPSSVQGEAVPGISQPTLESLPKYMPDENIRPSVNANSTVPCAPRAYMQIKCIAKGAVRPVRTVVLICVQRVWNPDDSTGELVCEPLSSPRLTNFRDATGLSASIVKGRTMKPSIDARFWGATS